MGGIYGLIFTPALARHLLSPLGLSGPIPDQHFLFSNIEPHMYNCGSVIIRDNYNMHVHPQLSGRIWCSRHTYQSQPFRTNVHADLWACERHRAQVFTPNYNQYLEILLTPPLSYDILLEFYINYTPDNHLLTCSRIHWYLKKVEDLCQR